MGEEGVKKTKIMPGQGSGQGKPTKAMEEKVGAVSGSSGEVQKSYINVGTVINGYSLTGVIAEKTGEADIFIGIKGGQSFAVKVYGWNRKPKPEILQAIRSIDSPYVIAVIEDGEFGGRYFEVLPYFEHGDLGQKAPLDPEFITNRVVPGLNNALLALHQRGIIHRDIKPNNIFFNDDKGHVVVGDFGISSVLESGITSRMTSGSRTLGYSAPEAAQGFVSKESDYYSMGITLLHLVVGMDPFQGMDEAKILMQTLMYKLEIPASIHPRIAHLIRGLTVKERKDRWGYEQVRKWLNNETVEVKESIRQRSDVKPYIFEGRELFGLPELSFSLAEHWEEATKHLYRGFIKDHVKQFGQDLASKAMDYEEERNKDLGLFKLINTINPEIPLSWRGVMFGDLSKLGSAIVNHLPAINDIYFSLLNSGAFLYFLEKKGYGRELIDAVKSLQDLSNSDKETAYFKLGYLLAQTNEFRFEDAVFNAVDDLVNYLYDKRDKVEEISQKLLGSKCFFVWLDHLGFGEHIEKWKQIEY